MTESVNSENANNETNVDGEKALPAVMESRVSRITRIIGALSEFEQEELSNTLQTLKIKRAQTRASTKNMLIFSLHTGVIGGLSAGLLMSILMASVVISLGGEFITVWTCLQMGGLFAVALTLFCAVYMFLLLKVATTSMAREAALKHTKLYKVQKVEIPVPLKDGIELSISAIGAKKGWTLESLDREDGTVSAISAATVRSPGELVGIKVDPLTENSCTVSIYSKPLFTIIDFGKNNDNVNLLAKEVEEAALVHQLLKME